MSDYIKPSSIRLIEILPVELWREIFEFLDGLSLYRAFGGLNSKFDAILSQISLYIDFKPKSNSETTNNTIKFNPLNVKTLKVTDVSFKLNAINCFFSLHPLYTFSHVQTVSLLNLDTENDRLQLHTALIDQLSTLKELHTLRLQFNWSIHNNNPVVEYLLRLVLNQNSQCFPYVKRFTLDNPIFRLPKVMTTTSLRHVSLGGVNIVNLISLYPFIPDVKSLQASIESYQITTEHQAYLLLTTPTSTNRCIHLELNLDHYVTFSHIGCLVKHTPELKKLSVRCYNTELAAVNCGKQWEVLLENYCSKLTQFKLVCKRGPSSYVYGYCSYEMFREEFQTDFWRKRNAKTETVLFGLRTDTIEFSLYEPRN